MEVRDHTPYKEIIEIRRQFLHPLYDGEFYYDIAVLELERKIIYDFDKFGDSPACLSEKLEIEDQEVLGLTFVVMFF